MLSGGQAAGGHNVISGVYDFVKSYSSHSQLFGFLGGPEGIYKGNVVEIDENLMEKYRNQGGFDMICKEFIIKAQEGIKLKLRNNFLIR